MEESQRIKGSKARLSRNYYLPCFHTERMSVAPLEQALAGLLTPNNVVIKQSRRYLFQMLKTPNSILGLMNRVDSKQNNNAGTRQVSAVLLRKVINKHWGKLDNPTRQNIQNALLHMITQEPEVLVRRALGAVIARLSKHLLPGWSQMLELINACASQQDSRFREQAYLLLYQSAEPIGRTLESSFAGLCQLYGKGLQDQDPKVRVMALKASSSLVSYVSKTNHVMQFQPLVPFMYKIVREAAVQLQEETAASLGLECFVDLALSQAPILKGHVGPLGKFALELGINRQCDIFLRDAALQVIINLCESKPKSMGKAFGLNVQQAGGLMREIVTALIQMCMEVDGDQPLDLGRVVGEGEDEDEDEDDGNRTPSNIALFCLDRLAIVMPNKCVYPVARDACLAGISSNKPRAVSASLFSFGAIAEGCSGAVMDELNQLMPIILSCANHTDQRVLGALCYALTMFSMYLGDAMYNMNSQWVSPVLELVLRLYSSDTRWYTRSKCLTLLEMLCEKTEPETLSGRGFLDPIMQVAQAALNDNQTAVDLQRKAVAVICSIVIACGGLFEPYFAQVFPNMRTLADDANESKRTLRGEAIQCIGHMAVAAGPVKFAPAVMDVMQVAARCIQTEDAELTEYVFNFFGSIAECLGPQFSSFLPDLIQDADLNGGASSLNFDEEEEEDEASNGGSGDPNESIDLQNGSDADDEDDGIYKAKVRTGAMDLKEAAVINLGRIAAACAGYHEDGQIDESKIPETDPFAPFVERTLSVMTRLTTYFHEQIRVKSIGVIRNMILGSYQVSKKPSSMQNENSRRCQQIVTQALPIFMLRMNKDFNREVAAVSVEAIDAIVNDLGPGCIENTLDALVQQLMLFLENKANCQQIDDDDDDEYEQEEDHDFILMDSVTDLIGTLARAFGSRFINHAIPLLQPLGRFLAPNRLHTDRSMAIGCYAELVQGIGSAMGGPHCASMLQVGQLGLNDEHHEVKRNACFLLGLLYLNMSNQQQSIPSLSSSLANILQSLKPYVEGRGQYDDMLVDNACSAVSKIMVSIINNNMSSGLAQSIGGSSTCINIVTSILPAFLQGLPLQSDHEEDTPGMS
jgi:hypothetical protein